KIEKGGEAEALPAPLGYKINRRASLRVDDVVQRDVVRGRSTTNDGDRAGEAIDAAFQVGDDEVRTIDREDQLASVRVTERGQVDAVAVDRVGTSREVVDDDVLDVVANERVQFAGSQVTPEL